MLSTPGGVKGVILRGIDPATAGEVLSLPRDMVQGAPADLDAPGQFPGIILGRELAERTGATVGSAVNILSPSGRQSAAGFTPKVKTFVVRGIFRSGMFEYDTSMAYVNLAAAQDLLGFKHDLVTGIEIRVDDVYAVTSIGERVREALGGHAVYVRNWIDM
jgi:lipoprotein-releasing system permease protein